ncbi:MAG: hypothetical protein QGD93_11430 [Actinomycetota bacterium]|nr:hypothetical protein [Actinomycetota bacterium]
MNEQQAKSAVFQIDRAIEQLTSVRTMIHHKFVEIEPDSLRYEVVLGNLTCAGNNVINASVIVEYGKLANGGEFPQ